MFYNTHIHIFEDKDVPRKFLPLGLVRILASKPGFNLIAKLLNNINPFSNNDLFNRYLKFVKIGKLGSQQKVFENCQRYYPRDTKFAVLSMDMAYMKAGKVPRPYREQLKELADLTKKYPQVIPFVHIDPRRKNFLDLLKESVEKWNFKGVKLYPPLGYFPYDKRLYQVYEYCVNQNLPIIAHCSPYNSVHYRGRKKNLKKLLSESKIPIDTKGHTKKDLCANFSNPKNWEYVLNDFKTLKVCLAHFGSEYFWEEFIHNPGNADNWFVLIKDMIPRHENLYTDISFTLNRQEYFPLLKVLLSNTKLNKKILFGSDYYMVETKTTERHFGLDLRAYIGETSFKAIAVDNPNAFFS